MKNSTTSNILHFSAAVVVSKILGAATTFCAASILLPADYGIWATLTLVISLSTIFLFGSVETLVKQVPYYQGQANEAMIGTVDGGVCASVFLSSALLLLLSLAFLFFHPGIAKGSLVHFIQITLVTAALSLFTCFFYYRLSAFSRFGEVSLLNSSRAFVTFLFVIALGWKWHLGGMVVGGLCAELSMLLLSIVLNKRLNRPVVPVFKATLLGNLIRIGFPITMVWWAYMVMTSIGRIISISLLGRTATGYYSLGVSIVSLIVLIPAAIGQVLYPQVSEKVGRNAGRESLMRYVVYPAQILSLVVPLILGVMLLLTPFVLRQFFPRYTPSISPAQILLTGAFFICFIKNGVNYLVATDKQSTVFMYVVVSLLVNVAVTVAAVKMNFNIRGIAAGTVTGSLLLTTLIWKSVFKRFGYPLRRQWEKIFQLYAPCFIMTAIVLLILGTLKKYAPAVAVNPGVTIPLFALLYFLTLSAVPYLRSWSVAMLQELDGWR